MWKSSVTYHVRSTCEMLCALWYSRTDQLFDRVEITFNFSFICWLKPSSDEEGSKPEYPEKTSNDQLQKMSFTKVRKFKLQPRLKIQYWLQALACKADVLILAQPCHLRLCVYVCLYVSVCARQACNRNTKIEKKQHFICHHFCQCVKTSTNINKHVVSHSSPVVVRGSSLL